MIISFCFFIKGCIKRYFIHIKDNSFTGKYWEWVTRALLIVYPLPPVKFPVIYEDLNVKFLEYNCLKTGYKYKEYKEELAFRDLAS